MHTTASDDTRQQLVFWFSCRVGRLLLQQLLICSGVFMAGGKFALATSMHSASL